MKIGDLDTPALLVDLDRLESNMARWQARCEERGWKNRPHIKTHKIPELARMQIAAGAVGVTCQKLGEIEAMAAGGVDDFLLAYPVVGELKLARLRALLERVGRLRVVADGPEVIAGLAQVARESGRELEVMVEGDTGMHRIGVGTPERAAQLAAEIAGERGLRFAGLMSYPATREAVSWMAQARALCEDRGLAVPEISLGGTPGMWGDYDGVSEYRAGTYLYNDRIIAAGGACMLADCALSVLLTVVSTAGEGWITLDGGTKTFGVDQYGQEGFGVLLDCPEAMLVRASEEHGVLSMHGTGEKPPWRVGEKLRVLPNHACMVSNLHDFAYGVRGEEVVAHWEITARGKLQ